MLTKLPRPVYIDMNSCTDEELFSLSKHIWAQNPVTSLRNILWFGFAVQGFLEFLKSEMSEEMFYFILEVRNLCQMPPAERSAEVIKLYKMVELATRKVGNYHSSTQFFDIREKHDYVDEHKIDPAAAFKKIREESDNTFRMLATDSFPRFLESPYIEDVVKMLDLEEDPIHQYFENEYLEKIFTLNYTDAETWLAKFAENLESFPISIIVADMTLPFAPVVYCNQAFGDLTGYTKDEVYHRNCKFMQGPSTEPEPVYIIRNSLSKGRDCRVSITNYRKDGSKFLNLLSLRPVFDAGDIYRYVVGIQMDVYADAFLKRRLLQLDLILNRLPTRLIAASTDLRKTSLSFSSNQGSSSRRKGSKVAKRARNYMLLSSIMRSTGKKVNRSCSSHTEGLLSLFGFTKIMWLCRPLEAMKGIVSDPIGREMFQTFCDITSVVYKHQFQYCCLYDDIAKMKVD